MKLTAKLVTVFLGIAIVLLAIDGYLSYRREAALFEDDIRRDAEILSKALLRVVEDVWQTDGFERVQELIADLNRQQHIHTRWLWLDAAPLELADRLADGAGTVSFFDRSGPPPGRYVTYCPAQLGGRRGALEIAESLDERAAHAQTSFRSSVFLAAALAGLCGLLFIPLGIRLVGRPLHRLAEKARAVGAGHLSDPVELAGRDELAELAGAINQMCEELAESQEKLRAETAERIAAIERLRHADRLRTIGRLASGVAHELGTPLNVVSGRASQIMKGTLSPEHAAEAAGIIKSQGDRMTAIIRQLLHFARPQPAARASMDLRQIAGQTLALLNPMARKRQVELILDDGEEVPAKVDARQLEQVMINLVTNAIDAMPRGGRVTVAVNRAPASHPEDPSGTRKHLRIEVRDEGIGISGEDCDQLFEPFFTTKDVGEGTGLGLAIVYGIVREHGGWIDVESETGHGTCFSVYLPATTEDEACKDAS